MTKEERNKYMREYYHKRKVEPEFIKRVRQSVAIASKKYHQTEKGKLFRAKNYQGRKDYFKTEKIRTLQKQYQRENSIAVKENKGKYYQENKKKFKEYHAGRKEKRNAIRRENCSNPINKLKNNLRSLITTGIKKAGYTKRSKLTQILGCSFEDFKQHFESQFTEGMNWVSVHCDHIIPISLAQTEEHVLLLSNYRNFRPCFINENLKKGAKIDLGLIAKHNLLELYHTITTITTI